ncbi:putative protein TPRXL [Ixodes scapularis]
MSTARYAKKRCSVEIWESNTRTAGISLHRFPLDSRRREAWVRFCNNRSLQGKTPWQPRGRVVCSLHFEESALLRPGHLRHNALPSVLPTKRLAGLTQFGWQLATYGNLGNYTTGVRVTPTLHSFNAGTIWKRELPPK